MGKLESLQSIYSTVLQEAASKDYEKDASFNEFVKEVTQILGEDAPDNDEVIRLIKEADDYLIALKAMETVKTEEDGNYPSSAYAYCPDRTKPETWELKLCESSGITKRMLDRAAASLSPGGLKGIKPNIPADDIPAVKRRVRNEYVQLGVQESDISRWVKEDATMVERSRITESFEIDIEEATAEGIANGIVPIKIIQPGFNVGKNRFYSDLSIDDASVIFEGSKMFADHPTKSEQRDRPERSIRDWVATVKNSRKSEAGNAVAEAHIHVPWMKELAQGLYEQGNLKELGVSINSIGKGVREKVQGVKTFMVEGLVKSLSQSVDFVTTPGAGGQAGVMESIQDTSIIDADLIDLATLREARPDLVELIEADIRIEVQKEVKKSMENEKEIAELRDSVAAITKERDDAAAKVLEAEATQAKASVQLLVIEAIGAHKELPEATVKKITEQFKDSADATKETIEEAIKAETDYIAQITEVGKVRGLGPSQTVTDEAEAKETHAALVEAFKRNGMSDKAAEDAANGR